MKDYWKPHERFECNDSMGDHKKREQMEGSDRHNNWKYVSKVS